MEKSRNLTPGVSTPFSYALYPDSKEATSPPASSSVLGETLGKVAAQRQKTIEATMERASSLLAHTSQDESKCAILQLKTSEMEPAKRVRKRKNKSQTLAALTLTQIRELLSTQLPDQFTFSGEIIALIANYLKFDGFLFIPSPELKDITAALFTSKDHTVLSTLVDNWAELSVLLIPGKQSDAGGLTLMDLLGVDIFHTLQRLKADKTVIKSFAVAHSHLYAILSTKGSQKSNPQALSAPLIEQLNAHIATLKPEQYPAKHPSLFDALNLLSKLCRHPNGLKPLDTPMDLACKARLFFSPKQRLAKLIQFVEFLEECFEAPPNLFKTLKILLQNLVKDFSDLSKKLVETHLNRSIATVTSQPVQVHLRLKAPSRQKIALLKNSLHTTFIAIQMCHLHNLQTLCSPFFSSPAQELFFKRFFLNLSYLVELPPEKESLPVFRELLTPETDQKIRTFFSFLNERREQVHNLLSFVYLHALPHLSNFMQKPSDNLHALLPNLRQRREAQASALQERLRSRTAEELIQNRSLLMQEVQKEWIELNEPFIRLVMLIKDAEQLAATNKPWEEETHLHLMPLELAEYLDVEEELAAFIDQLIAEKQEAAPSPALSPLEPAPLKPSPSKPLPQKVVVKKSKEFAPIQGNDKRRTVLNKLAAVGFFEKAGGRHPHVVNATGVEFPVPLRITPGVAKSLNAMVESTLPKADK